ncbi:hypothetical protein LLE49_09100 [Alicyclobacillus tolerans]|uniref:hypothetical protein n=1 Tax=Alicyclobacillus tolerans TaxID=90970 RepID=UPI001F16D8D4|nr:hypothetical protein [Alicyclobacillus tolerans]MCF8564874.1 hypothetical protein [Alicyclobacillus tolerans]
MSNSEPIYVICAPMQLNGARYSNLEDAVAVARQVSKYAKYNQVEVRLLDERTGEAVKVVARFDHGNMR